MAHLPHRCHGNFPQRQTALVPQVSLCKVKLTLETQSSETASILATRAEGPVLPAEQLCIPGSCDIENTSTEKINTASQSAERQRKQPEKDVAALLKTIRIPPEAQRILGHSCIPVVNLERLNLQSMWLSSLQPVVSLVRLQLQTQAVIHDGVSCLNHPEQNGFREIERIRLEISDASLSSDPVESSHFVPTEPWTEPLCPESPPSEEPEQDSGFDCESNPDQPFILFDSGSEEWDHDVKSDSGMFYVDPDPEQTLVIELDPEPEMDQYPCQDEPEMSCEGEEVEMEVTEDQNLHVCWSQEEAGSCIQQSGTVSGPEEMESEDFCAVCQNGGDLLCCDRCPKVYHLSCHIPPLISYPLGDWVCSLCRTDQDPMERYDCEDPHSHGGFKALYTLSSRDQRRCEKLTLLLCCHSLSAPFHEPVSPLARNYYQIIKRPIDLSLIRRKLDKSNTLHYFTAEQFVDDVLLMFKNCATFNYPDSEVAQAGRNLELFFLNKLKEIFPDGTFLSACQERMDRAHFHWPGRKRKEHYRRKRLSLSGKRYLL